MPTTLSLHMCLGKLYLKNKGEKLKPYMCLLDLDTIVSLCLMIPFDLDENNEDPNRYFQIWNRQ